MKSLYVAISKSVLHVASLFTLTLLFVSFAAAEVAAPGGPTANSFAAPATGTGAAAASGGGVTGMPSASGMFGSPGTAGLTNMPQGTSNALSGTSQPGMPVPVDTMQQTSKSTDSPSLKVDSVKASQQPISESTPERSFLEQSLTKDSTSAENTKSQSLTMTKITQFGYGFFRPDAAGFAALTDIPVGPDYMLGVGDRIVLTLWGSIDGVYDLEINRQGEAVLPKVGPVRLVGTTFERLPAVLKTHLAKVFKDFQLNVNIGKLRTMKVYVVGDVHHPGDYNISSLSTVLNALSAAGGPTKSGTLRNVQIKRNGKLVESVDLYDFFLKGDKSRDIRLQPGDTIFVPPIGQVAGVAGNVRRPAIFELKGEKTLKELLSLADGVNPGAYLQRLQIYRLEANSRNVVVDTNLNPSLSGKSLDDMAADIGIQDMDMVKVFPIDATLRGYARLSGYVLRPGDYALKPGMRLKDLLLPDNLLPEYNTEMAVVTRLFAPDFHPEKIFINLKKALTGDESQNLLLQEFDELIIFSRWEVEEMPRVRISGEVQKPGDFRLYDNMTVRDLLLLAGNPKRTAYLKSAEISRIKKSGDSVTSISINVNIEEALKGDSAANIRLEPYDELSVRKIPNWSEETDRYITLKGEFMFPGTYPIYKGERLSNLIRRAGGYTERAYLKSAKLIRKQVQEIQQKRMTEVLARTEIDLQNKQAEIASTASSQEELAATKAAMDSLSKSLAVLKSAKAEGRMIITLLPLDQLANSEYDFEVMGGDELNLGTDPQLVNVLGEVYNQTSFMFQPSAAVGDYLFKAGGLTRTAEEDDAYIVKIDGTVVSRSQSSGGFMGYGGFMFMHPDSGDTIVIPKQIEKVAWIREIKDIATILGQLAITAGVLIAAGL